MTRDGRDAMERVTLIDRPDLAGKRPRRDRADHRDRRAEHLAVVSLSEADELLDLADRGAGGRA